jgi:hypothetical protein
MKLLRLSDLKTVDVRCDLHPPSPILILDSSFNVVWLNLLNLSAFPLIATMFELDPLLSSYFHDLRPHSVAVSSESGVLVCRSDSLSFRNSHTLVVSLQCSDGGCSRMPCEGLPPSPASCSSLQIFAYVSKK